MARNAAKFDTLRSIAFGSITSSFTPAGPSLPDPCVAAGFKNTTDAVIEVSFDGINPSLIYPPQLPGGVYDIRTNAPNNCDYLLPTGTIFSIAYVGSAPTKGSFYIETLIIQV